MAANSINSPFPIITDIDGQPLEGGYIWIGVAGLDPQTNPQNAYWDSALTALATQPVRTIGGYPIRSGSPGRLYANGDYSVRIMNKNGTIIYSSLYNLNRITADQVGFTGPDGLPYLVSDFADSTSVLKGDALLAVKQPFPLTEASNQHLKNKESVSVFDFMDPIERIDVETSAELVNVNLAIVSALQSGVSKLYFPPGTYSITSNINATITNDIEIVADRAVIKYVGIANVAAIMILNCDGYNFTMKGLEFHGNSLITGGPRIENNVDNFIVIKMFNCCFHDFYMHAVSNWNHGYLIRGAIESVYIERNIVYNITRAAGTGNSGVSGTSGGNVTQLSDTRYPKNCIHVGNEYRNIKGGDVFNSVANVDYDGFAFFCPDPTKFPNSDTTVYAYPPSRVFSNGNTYYNCRGRAIKVQGIADIHSEKIIRDSDYTINPGSSEINLQWGVGTIKDIQFFYRDYLVSGVVTSPIQTSVDLISSYQGSDYGENNAGVSVSGIRVLNSIKTAVGNNINAILSATLGAGPQVKRRPLLLLNDVVINRGTITWIATTSFSAGAYCLLKMSDIVIDKLTYAAIGTNSTNENCEILATGVFHLDGIVTPANARRWVRNLADGGDRAWSGKLTGFGNRGFLEAFSGGSSYNQSPLLEGGALSGFSGPYGAGLSVQSLFLADDAIGAFVARGYTANTGMFGVVTNGAHTGNGWITSSGGALYSLTSDISTDFALSVVGTNPDTDGKLNFWVSGGVINVKNRLGASRLVSIVFFG